MRCPSCGNLNREGARFCDNCGFDLESSATRAEPPAPEAAASAGAPAGAPAPVEIDGRYEIAGDLGRGGRKRVYLACDRVEGGRQVAVALFETAGIAETAV